MKKIFNLLIVSILFISLISFASAMTTEEQSILNKMTNPFSQLNYGISKGLFFFTTWGQANGCSISSNDQAYGYWEGWIRGSMSKPTSLSSSVSCSKVGTNKCAIDVWYDNTAYLGTSQGPPSNVDWNKWVKEVSGTGVSFSGNAYSYYYVQIYGCPDNPPSTTTHTTTAYKCQSGSWSSKGSYGKTDYCSYDTSGVNLCWCSSSNNNFYIDQSGAVHCASSDSSSWCSSSITHSTKQCVASGTTESFYWYDNLGNQNDLIQTCSDTQKCTLDGCVDKTTSETQTNSDTCGNGVCTIGERFGAPFGTLCNQDCERTDLKDNIQIYNVNYLDVSGNKLPDKLIPGQQIKVTFSVRATTGFKNTPYLVEAGVIPFSTAESWGMAQPSGFYSVFNLFSTQESTRDACCKGQPNVADNFESLQQTFWSDTTVKDFSFTIRVPDSSTTDFCGSNSYWDVNSSKEVIYITVKNGCFKDGYKRNVFVATTTQLESNATVSQQGKSCEFDGQCAVGEKCLDAPGFFTGKTCQGGPGTTSGNLSLIDLRKIPLTQNEMGSATTNTLIASACWGGSGGGSECLSRENYSVSCESIKSLKNKGYLTQSQEDSFVNKAKSALGSATTGAEIGAGLGIAACTVGVVGANVAGYLLTGPAGTAVTAVSLTLASNCFNLVVGGTAAGAVIGANNAINYKETDPLVKALKAGDDSNVGICTATPKSSGFDLSNFDFNATAFPLGTFNVTWLMVIVGVIILLFLFMSMGGKK